MLVNQKVLDTLVAPTYTSVVSSHSHSHSPRQYLDESVETKRAATCCHSTFPSACRPGIQNVSRRFRHRRRSASGRLSPQRVDVNVWCYETEVKGKRGHPALPGGGSWRRA